MIVNFNYEEKIYRFEHPDDDHIGCCQQSAKNFYEIVLLEELRQRLGDVPGIVIDVGAHIGNHTVYFASVMKRTVIVFEPNPRVLPLLIRNVSASGVERSVSILGCAASSVPGWCDVPDEPRTAGNTGMQRVVFNHSGDTLCLPIDCVKTRVALIKFDIEGAELSALRGAEEILRTSRPLLAIEASTSQVLSAQRAFLEPLGFQSSGRSWGATPVYVWTHVA